MTGVNKASDQKAVTVIGNYIAGKHCKASGLAGHEVFNPATGKVYADMPSMPMAHNMRQIMATPVAGLAGQYEFVLVLEMAGGWRLIYNISNPFIDRLYEPLIIGISDKSKQHKSSYDNTIADHSSMHGADHN